MFIFRDLIAEDTILPKPGPHLEARSLYVCIVAAVVAYYLTIVHLILNTSWWWPGWSK